MKFEWEWLSEGTVRAKVFGGWVLQTYEVPDELNYEISQTLVFIPDPNHEWVIDK